MRVRWCVAMAAAIVATGCAGPVPLPLLRAAPTTYLLGIDQLVSPDFTFDDTPHAVTAADLVSRQGGDGRAVAHAGFTGAAVEDFFRQVPDLAELNGPVQVGDTVAEFSSPAGAAAVYAADVARLDAVPGSAAVSTGALGDAAHATTRAATLPDGTAVVQITVEWRVDNLLDVVIVRGRDGAVRPDDALTLAHRQTVGELGLATAPAATTSSG